MAADPLTKSTVDDLFGTEFSDFDDDPFADNPVTTIADTRDDKTTLSPRAALKRKANDAEADDFGLGLDSEVKILKKKKPIAKLDEARLLSGPGIPKLRALTRSGQLSGKLRLKGKGHEFTDAARLLNHFQLWLDDLYPRAKFADALQLVEKAGHTKRMHITRTEWINEGKPGYTKYETLDTSGEQPQNEPELFDSQHQAQTNSSASNEAADDDGALFIPDANQSARPDRYDEPNDDELDALLAEQEIPSGRDAVARPNATMNESEGEDDLDALLAERDMFHNFASTTPGRPLKSNSPNRNSNRIDEEDELDALLAEQEARDDEAAIQVKNPSGTGPSQAIHDGPEPDEDEDDELEALLAASQVKSKSATNLSSLEPSLPTPQATSSPVDSPTRSQTQNGKMKSPTGLDNRSANFGLVLSSSPVPNNPEDLDLDDLDALLASQEAKTHGASASAADHLHADKDGSTTPKARKVRQTEDDLLSSSPIPNQEDSQ